MKDDRNGAGMVTGAIETANPGVNKQKMEGYPEIKAATVTGMTTAQPLFFGECQTRQGENDGRQSRGIAASRRE